MGPTLPGTYHYIESSDTFPYLLPHRSVNPDAASTIVLIRGAFSSHYGFEGVLSSDILSNYHLILPDLHSDGSDKSKGISPFEISRVANLISHLIKEKAKNGQAHLVGVSLGAHVAFATAALYPEVVEAHSIFVSGYNNFHPSSFIKPFTPYLFYGLNKLGDFWSNSKPNDEENNRPKDLCTLKLVKEMDGALFGDANSGESVVGEEGLKERTCIVVATHRSSGDRIPHAQRLYEKIQGSDTGGRGHIIVQNRKMQHPWNSIEPKLFATCVLAWIEGKELPVGFERC